MKFKTKVVHVDAIQYCGIHSYEEIVREFGSVYTVSVIAGNLVLHLSEGKDLEVPENYWIVRDHLGNFQSYTPLAFHKTFESR